MTEVRYAVVDPSSGDEVQSYPTHTDEQVTSAVARAHEAFTQWSRGSTVDERAALVRRVAELHTERREQLAETINREMGKPLEDALGEVDFSAAIYAYYADNAAGFLADEKLSLLEGEGEAVVRRRPLGVLLGIMPWNFPAYQVARFAGPNLAAGNTIVLKHAPQCPESAAALETIFRDAGFPDGAYVNIYATNEQVEQVIADPRVQGVSLTGSEPAGAAVAEIAGRHLKKVVLELGGSDPFIVLSSDDLDATVDAAVAARLDNTGQSCNAGKRMIVHESLYDDFLPRFTQRMLETPPAPLSSKAAAKRLEQQVADAVAQGANLDDERRAPGRLVPAGRAHGHHPRGCRVPPGAVRPRRHGVQGARRGRGGGRRQRHAVRSGVLRLHHRPCTGGAGRGADRRRHGLHQRCRRRGRRAALRWHQAVRVRP